MSHAALVWIDQNECMGAGTCAQIVPEVFEDIGQGLWGVAEKAPYFEIPVLFNGGNGSGQGPAGHAGKARVPAELIDDVVDAVDECPGECIYLEPVS